MSDLVKIGAAWRGKGKAFATGKMGDARLLIFENRDKKNDKYPDFTIYVAKDEPRDKPQGNAPDDLKDDEIPF